MFALKRIILIVLTLSSDVLFAGTMGPVCAPSTVTVPCSQTGWSVTANALYLQTDLNQTFSYYPRGDNDIYNGLGGQWGWGFQLGGSYLFNTGNDVTVNWYHLDGASGNLKFNPLGEFDPLNIRLALKTQWDAVNGELGQFATLTRDVSYRFHGGFQFARLKNTMNARLAFIVPADFLDLFDADSLPAPHNLRYTTSFNGFGPRTGVDMDYMLGNGFSMYAKTAAALLVGSSKAKTTGLAQPLTSVQASYSAIVPQLEASVGLNYRYPTKRGDFLFDLGYLWVNYFNPLRNQNLMENVANNQSVTTENRTTDLSISGLYFGFKYVANI
ncbi:Lpg1974 family pore-forming outer membrane protein [Legionella saoudiensis]|uniref:Lpg1974 family pore-forming outer membrane protein n=1 Tax=Legionella saoudiensis TaxID=1750561 RepID=UPI0007300B66|nr:Lpg1974 family pore-forming outer membrane protein [Legionella saoudiensis]